MESISKKDRDHPFTSDKNLVQPILSTSPEYGHETTEVLGLDEFLTLLKEEENYFGREANNIKLNITRLRKIFYDRWGWNTQLIRKAASIEGRYDVKIVECPSLRNSNRALKQVKRYSHNSYTPLCRLVTYKENDRVFGNSKVGVVPEIYKCDHADVLLPEGYHCDMAHVLAGLDALNNFQVVSPLPDGLFFLHKYFPYANSNADVATWLGDIATSAMDFLFYYLDTEYKPLTSEIEQFYVDVNASASDMLGNIDGFVIHHICKAGLFKEMRISEIFENYYDDGTEGASYRAQRFQIFVKSIGLQWEGSEFLNRKEWIEYYKSQLRNTVSFMVFSVLKEFFKRIVLPFRVWNRDFEKTIKLEILLDIFLDSLKRQLL